MYISYGNNDYEPGYCVVISGQAAKAWSWSGVWPQFDPHWSNGQGLPRWLCTHAQWPHLWAWHNSRGRGGEPQSPARQRYSLRAPPLTRPRLLFRPAVSDVDSLQCARQAACMPPHLTTLLYSDYPPLSCFLYLFLPKLKLKKNTVYALFPLNSVGSTDWQFLHRH